MKGGDKVENMEDLLFQRKRAWMLLFEYSEFNIRNMDAPIDPGQLHYLPFHPATNTCLYVMNIESPIRYAVNRATIMQDKSAV